MTLVNSDCPADKAANDHIVIENSYPRVTCPIKKLKKLEALLILIALSVYFYYCLAYLNNIGLNYDETLFVNAALGGITNDLIYKKIFNVPLMLMPYMGVLKSWIYYPIFKVSEVNIYSIRLPAILMSALTLYVWYKNSKIFFENNRIFSLLFLFIIATDPIFIIQSKLDIGPTVLQNLFIALTFYLYLMFINQRSSYYLAGLFLTISLGLYNKANFIWFASAFIVAALSCDRKIIISIYRQNDIIFNVIITIFLFIVALVILLMVIPSALNCEMGSILHFTMPEKLIYFYHLFAQTTNGAVMFYYLFNNNIDSGSLVNGIEYSILLIWLIGLCCDLIMNRRFFESKRAIFFILTIMLLEIIQIILTPQGRLPSHILVVWPLYHLVFIFILRSFYAIKNHLTMNCILLLPIILIASQLYVNDIYLLQFKNPYAYRNTLWSSAVFNLSEYINHLSGEYDVIVSLDYGLNNQLFSLATNNNERKKFHDAWFLFTDNSALKRTRNYVYPVFNQSDHKNMRWLYENYFKEKRTLVVAYTEHEWVAGLTEKFYHFLNEYHLKIEFITSISDNINQQIYNLYAVTK